MKTLPITLLPTLLTIAASYANPDAAPPASTIAASVNGESILKSEVEKSLLLTEIVVGAADFEKNREEIRNSALQKEVDRRLLRQEFKRMGGQIKAQYIDELLEKLTASRFNGNVEFLKTKLEESGITERELRGRLEDEIIFGAIRSQHNNQKDPQNPLNGFDQWLEALRAKATIEIVE